MSAPAVDTCPLTPAQQRRNLILFAINVSINYLGAPILYIGTHQGNLIKNLPLPEGAIETLANLPTSIYFGFTFPPVLIAWYFCEVRLLKRVMSTCQMITALSLFAVATILWLAPSPETVAAAGSGANPMAKWAPFIVAAVVLQAAAIGTAGSASVALSWEALGRGASSRLRGLALSLAFGVGPFFAFVSSMYSNLLIAGKVSIPYFWFGDSGFSMLTWTITKEALGFPRNYALLYGIVTPMFVIASLLSYAFIVPQPTREEPRKALWDGVFGGIGNFVWIPVLRWAGICTILGYSANLIITNLSNNSLPAMGIKPEECAGYQLAARFLMKGFAGLLLGWLVARSTPWSGMVATISMFAATLAWALVSEGNAYLFTFALFGAGELLGAYAVNYILSASPQNEYRRNMVLANLLYAPTFFFGILFGRMTDWVKGKYALSLAAGEVSEMTVLHRAYQTTFVMCLVFLVTALLIAMFILPRNPRPNAAEV